MEYNFVTNIENCYFGISQLVYYSHIPVGLVSIIMGFFVFFKSGKSLLGKILFVISISFSLWTFLDLIVWTNYDSRLVMFSWSLMGFLYALIYVACIYFVYVYIDKKDVGFYKKIIFVLLLMPIVFLIPTNFNLESFDVSICEAVEGHYFTSYYYGLGFFIFIWVLFVSAIRYIKADFMDRKQILALMFGMGFFLASFFITGFLASYLDNFELEQYGLFGMVVFMGMLAYMIVKFRAFNIKMIGAQALVVTLFIIIAAQFAFIQNPTNRILNGIAVVLIAIFGWNLIRGVKREIAQKEALELANHEINERKDQLQKISDHLAIANAKLKELDTAKSEFVSIVAHQLQGPPTTVKGYSMLLSDGSYGEMNADQKDVLQKIFNANEQQIEFVNDLLNVSRLESGRINFAFEDCDVREICQEVVDNLFIKAKGRDLYLEYNKPEDIPTVNVDKAKIREAITNLVDNAIKYTKKGGVSILIKICSGTEKCLAGNHIRVVISDTGIGVPESEMIHLFSKFSRGKDVKRLNAGGTGLGLYVVKMIVEGNHGHVWVESDGEGKGSRFIIELPFN